MHETVTEAAVESTGSLAHAEIESPPSLNVTVPVNCAGVVTATVAESVTSSFTDGWASELSSETELEVSVSVDAAAAGTAPEMAVKPAATTPASKRRSARICGETVREAGDSPPATPCKSL